MSNRLTFSLASFIFILALGLVFVPTAVMADNVAGADHGGTDADGHPSGSATAAGHVHPTVTIEIVDANLNIDGNQEYPDDDGRDQLVVGVPFKVKFTFSHTPVYTDTTAIPFSATDAVSLDGDKDRTATNGAPANAPALQSNAATPIALAFGTTAATNDVKVVANTDNKVYELEAVLSNTDTSDPQVAVDAKWVVLQVVANAGVGVGLNELSEGPTHNPAGGIGNLEKELFIGVLQSAPRVEPEKPAATVSVADDTYHGGGRFMVTFTFDADDVAADFMLMPTDIDVSDNARVLPDSIKKTKEAADAMTQRFTAIIELLLSDNTDDVTVTVKGDNVKAATGADGMKTVMHAAAAASEDMPTPAMATQIGSKNYLVFVPMHHNPDALPGNLTGKTHTIDDMPNLVDFFRTGGTIDVVVTGKEKHNVIITEIMLAEDLGREGSTGVNRPEAGQWIEIYNNTDAHINISDISLKFRVESPATAMPDDTTDRISNTVTEGGKAWGIATFADALSGETAPVAGSATARTVTANFNSIRRVHKDNKALQDAGTVIQDGWLSSSWTLTASTRVFRAGRIGTPGQVNRPTVFKPAVYVAPDMSVTFNEIANLNDDTNEWIELKGPADTNMRKYKIEIVTGYDKETNKGTVDTIFEFPDNDDIKIPSTGILLLTDKSPVENKLEADLEDGVEKPVRYRIKTLAALPNGGDFLLVLRNKDGKILDVAGHVSDNKLRDNDPYTLMWPLAGNAGVPADKVGKTRISPNNALKGGNVYKRARAIQGHLANKDDGKEPAFEGAGFTGIGYDRNVSPGNNEHHGTPGYENGIQIGAGAEATDNVVISEVMYGDGTHSLPQWIEIQNRSTTKGVDLHNWKLYVVNHSMNADGSAFTGKVVDGIFLRNMKIPPRQTALVVSKAGQNRTSLPPHRVLNLKRKGNDALLSSKGFYLYLVANAHEGDLAKRQAGDAAGNLPAPKEVVAGDNIKLFNDAISTLRAFQGMDPAWELPAGVNDNDYRVSVARKGSAKILNPDGTAKFHWVSSADDKRSYNLGTSYGRLTDIGSPGNTPGAALPVSLSKFRPERMKDTGEIVVRWVTESELNNAGFNILRSEKRDKDFTKIHFEAGEGTTSERTVYEWKDTSAKPNVVYYYQIQDVSLDGEVTTLRTTHLRGNVTAAGKATTTWGAIKALRE